MADKSLFTRLKRLFSTDVIIRNEGGNLRVMDVNKIQQTGEFETNSLVDRFNRVWTNSGTSLYGYQSTMNYQTLRPQLYSDYDAMDTDAIIASALDIIADEAFKCHLQDTEVRFYTSKREEVVVELNSKGCIALAIDPLDGSSNIDTNVSIGSIFSTSIQRFCIGTTVQ